jgi:hypothetical protein
LAAFQEVVAARTSLVLREGLAELALRRMSLLLHHQWREAWPAKRAF